MFHPLETNLRDLTDTEIEEKIHELTRKYFTAQRLGMIDLLTQISTFVTIYKSEMSRRNFEKLKADQDSDLGQLINVNK